MFFKGEKDLQQKRDEQQELTQVYRLFLCNSS